MNASGEAGPRPTHQHGEEPCPECAVTPRGSRSGTVAWSVAAIAVALLVAVFFVGIGTSGGTLLASAGLPLLALLICPLVMGGMMLMMMMRKGH